MINAREYDVLILMFGFHRHMCIAGAVVFRMGFNASEYVPKMSNVGMLTAGIGDNMISYVLFWTLGYALVHIY